MCEFYILSGETISTAIYWTSVLAGHMPFFTCKNMQGEECWIIETLACRYWLCRPLNLSSGVSGCDKDQLLGFSDLPSMQW